METDRKRIDLRCTLLWYVRIKDFHFKDFRRLANKMSSGIGLSRKTDFSRTSFSRRFGLTLNIDLCHLFRRICFIAHEFWSHFRQFSHSSCAFRSPSSGVLCFHLFLCQCYFSTPIFVCMWSLARFFSGLSTDWPYQPRLRNPKEVTSVDLTANALLYFIFLECLLLF